MYSCRYVSDRVRVKLLYLSEQSFTLHALIMWWWQQQAKTFPLILQNSYSLSSRSFSASCPRGSAFSLLLVSNQFLHSKSESNNQKVQSQSQCLDQVNRARTLVSKQIKLPSRAQRFSSSSAATPGIPVISQQLSKSSAGICHGQARRMSTTTVNNGVKASDSEPLSNHIAPIHTLSVDSTAELRADFYKDVKNQVALHACTKMDPLEVCLTRSGLEDISHVFSHKVEIEGKPMTNQKQSGRCWIFAFLNAARVPFMKQYNIDEFEFSQNYLFFWDKLERANHFLNVVVEACRNGEDSEGRLLSFLLHDPISDGGQWDMLVNLVQKYGLMPKKCFPESFSSESSARMNAMLRSKLREYTKVIYEFMKTEPSEAALSELLRSQMSEVHKIVAICLGIPKNEFVWEYYDKSKAYHKIGPISPLKFYQEHVKPVFDVEDKVCLINDPRPKNEYGRLYSVQYLGNMTGGRPTIYNNQPVDLLKKMVVESIKAGEAVWFGCEVQKRFAVKQGLEDLKIHDYQSVFGLDVSLPMSKAERLLYGESAMSHAMVITAVGLEGEAEIPLKFRVENSWGDDRCEKGYILMTSEWFDEFVFEVVVDKSHVPEEVLAVFQQAPVVLPAWDPMGTLAH